MGTEATKPACLRLPHLTPATGDEYYYSMLVLFKPFRNETTDLIHEGESPRDAYVRQTDDFDINSSNFMSMAQSIQDAIVQIRIQDASTPLDISAQVAPPLKLLNLTSMVPVNKMMNTYDLIHHY